MPSVTVRDSGTHGLGVFATRSVRKGERVFRFTGQIVDWQHCTHRSLQVGESTFIRPDKDALPGFLNHSCEPNCAVRDLNAITALRAIKAGEEILIDYSFTDDMPGWDMTCHCGAKSCRKRLVPYHKLTVAYRKKWKERTSEYLIRSASDTPAP
jgi:SET domain-containing protein